MRPVAGLGAFVLMISGLAVGSSALWATPAAAAPATTNAVIDNLGTTSGGNGIWYTDPNPSTAMNDNTGAASQANIGLGLMSTTTQQPTGMFGLDDGLLLIASNGVLGSPTYNSPGTGYGYIAAVSNTTDRTAVPASNPFQYNPIVTTNGGQSTGNLVALLGQAVSTIALDANAGGDRPSAYLYAWPWEGGYGDGQETSAQIAQVQTFVPGLPNPYLSKSGTSTGIYNTWEPIYRWAPTQQQPDITAVPTPAYFEPAMVNANGGGSNDWSGGEVVQANGDLFMSGAECLYLDGGYRMMIFNPQTGQYNYSGQIQPQPIATAAVPDNDIFNNNPASLNDIVSCDDQSGMVASDMALDANGNAYILVYSDMQVPTMGVTTGVAYGSTGTMDPLNRHLWLVRVVPGANAGDPWYYNLVAPLQAAPGEALGSPAYEMVGTFNNNQGATLSGASWNYGMAFYNGYLYASTYGAGAGNATFIKINPMTGEASSMPAGGSYTASGTPYIMDMASGQAAYVVQGTIYNDANANGKLDSGEQPLSGIQVALYYQDPNNGNKWTYESTHNTDANGQYSFLTGGMGNYIVRLVQPTIPSFIIPGGTNEVHAVETWASGGTYTAPNNDTNKAIPVCTNDPSGSAWAGGPDTAAACDGAMYSPYTETPTPAGEAALGTDTSMDPANMPIQTALTFNTSGVVADADFGLTAAGSTGDASAGPASIDAGAPVHVNGNPADAQVWLGAKLGTYADSTTNVAVPVTDNKLHNGTDDGLYIGSSKTPFGPVSIGPAASQQSGQNNTLVEGHPYNLEATVSGPKASSALVNGWTTGVGNTTWGTNAVWAPTSVASGVAQATVTLAPAASTTAVQELRANVTLGTTSNTPSTNTNGQTVPTNNDASAPYQYQGQSPSNGSHPWVTPGEIEDYAYNMAPAAYRPALVSGGNTIAGPVTVTPGSDSTTGTTPQSFLNITTTPQVGGGVGTNGGASTFDVANVPNGDAVTAQVYDTESGTLIGPATTSVSGSTWTIGFTVPVTDDYTVLVTITQPPDPTHSSITCVPTGPIDADGVTAYTCTATLKAADGTPLPGQTVDFTGDASSPLMVTGDNKVATAVSPSSAATCVTGSDGTCQVTVTSTVASKDITKDYNLHAFVDTTLQGGAVTDPNWKEITDTADTPAHGSPVLLTFQAGPVCADCSYFTVSPTADPTDTTNMTNWQTVSDGTKGAGYEYTVTVWAYDQQGNPELSLNNEALVPKGAGTPSGASINVSSVKNNGDGSYTYTVSSKVAQSDSTIGATVDASGTAIMQDKSKNDGGTVTAAPIPFKADGPGPCTTPPDGSPYTTLPGLTAVPSTDVPATAPGSGGSLLTATVTDEYCNPIKGATVDFAPDSSVAGSTVSTTANVAPTTGTTDANGQVTAQLTDTKAQTVNPTATVTQVTTGSGATAVVTPVTPPVVYTTPVSFIANQPSAAGSTLTVTTPVTNTVVSPGSIGTATAQINDEYGNAVPAGTVVTFTLPSSGSYAVFSNGSTTMTATTDKNGVASVTYSDSRDETVPLHATIDQSGTQTDLDGIVYPATVSDPTLASPQDVTFNGKFNPDGGKSTWEMVPCTSGATQVVADGNQCYLGTLTLNNANGDPVNDDASDPTSAINVVYTSTPTGVTEQNITHTVGTNVYTAEFVTSTSGTFNVSVTADGVQIYNLTSSNVTGANGPMIVKTATATGAADASAANSNYALTYVPGKAFGPNSLLQLSTDDPAGYLGNGSNPDWTSHAGTPGSIAVADASGTLNPVTATVWAISQTGAPVPQGSTVTLTLPASSGATFASGTGVTNGGKTYTTTTTDNTGKVVAPAITDPTAEAVTVTAVLGDPASPDATLTQDVTFTPGPFDPANSIFTVSPVADPSDTTNMANWGTADGSVQYIGTVQAFDKEGNPITGMAATDFTYTVKGAPSAATAADEAAKCDPSTATGNNYTADCSALWASPDYTVTASYNGTNITGHGPTTPGTPSVNPAPIPFKAGAIVPIPSTPTQCVDPVTGNPIADRWQTNIAISSPSQAAGTPATVTVQATDVNCNPVSGATINFTPTGAAAMYVVGTSTPASSATTDSTGTAKLDVNDQVAQSVNVSTTANSTTPTGTVTTVFTAGPPVPGPITTCPTQNKAGGTAMTTATPSVPLKNNKGTGSVDVYVTDQYCNAITDANGASPATIYFTTDNGTLSSASATTDPATGIATVNLTDTEQRTDTVKATLGSATGDPVNPAAGVKITFTEGNVDPANSSFTCVITPGSTTPTPIANGTDSYTCTILAQDTDGNLVKDVPNGTFNFDVNGTPVGPSKVTASGVTNNGDGTYTVQFTTTTADPTYTVSAWYGSDTDPTNQISGTLSGHETTMPATPIPFTFGAPIPPDQNNPTCQDGRSKTNTTADPTSVKLPDTTGDAGTSTVTTLVTDINCNPVSGVKVDWTVAGGTNSTATLSPTSATTGDDGTVTTTLSDLTAELTTTSAKVTGDGVTDQNGGSADVTFTPGDPMPGPIPTCPTSSMTGSQLTATTLIQLGGTSSITANITDANCNVVPGVVVTFGTQPNNAAGQPTGADGALTLTTTQGTTGPNGNARATLADPTAETVLVTATLPDGSYVYAPAGTSADSTGANTQAPVVFQAGNFSGKDSTFTCVVTDPSTMATPPVADGVQSYTCTIHAVDANKNPLTTSDGIDLSGFTINVPSYVTGPDGNAPVVTEVNAATQPGVYTTVLVSTKATWNTPLGQTASSTYNNIPIGADQPTVANIPFQAGDPIPPAPDGTTKCTTGANNGSLKTNTQASPTQTKVGPASATSGSTITTLVTDQFCNPISGATVTYTATGDATASTTVTPPLPNPATTDANGQAQIFLVDNTAETSTVDANKVDYTDPTTSKPAPTVDGGSANVTFIADIVQTPVCRVMVDGVYYSVQSTQVYPYKFVADPNPDSSLVDSYGDPVPMTTASVMVGDTQDVRTYLLDAHCNPEVGYTVAFTGTPAGTQTTTTTQKTTDTDGMAAGNVTDTKVETVAVGGGYAGGSGNTDTGNLLPANVDFTAGAFDPSKSVFVVSPSNVDPTDTTMAHWVTADGSSTYSGTVFAYDANGNPLTNLSATDFTYTVTGANASTVKVTPGASTGNQYYVTFSSPVSGADLTVTAAYIGAPDTPATSAQITGSNATDGTTVTTWMGGAKVASGTGGAPIPFKAGPATPTCTQPPGSPYATPSNMTITPASQPAGTAADVTAFLSDANCNPVTNTEVDFTPSGSGFMVPSSSTATTDSNGNATIKVNDYVAETVTVTTKSPITLTGTTQFVAGPPVPGPIPNCPLPTMTGTAMSANPTDVHLTGTPASGTSTITARITDQYCNPETDTSNPVTVDFATTGSSTLSDSSAQTDSTGTATVTLTDTTPETVTVTGTLPVQTGVTTAATINPTAGVPVTFDTAQFDGTRSSFTCVVTSGSTTPVPTANGSDSYTCTILARDINGAPLASLTSGSWSFPVMAGSPAAATKVVNASSVTNVGDGTYTVVFTSTTADPSFTVTALNGGTEITGSAVNPADSTTYTTLQPNTPIPFQAGPAVPPDKSNPTCSDKIGTGYNTVKTNTAITTDPATIAPMTSTAGTPASITTLVTDANCNPISGAAVTWTPNSNSTTATVTPVTATTGSDGKATADVNDRVAEYVSVSASETDPNGTQNAGSDSVTFVAGPPVTGPVTDCPTSDMSGSNLVAASPVQEGFTSAVTAKVTDANCNPVSGIPVTFSIAGPATASIYTTAGQVIASTNGQGIATATATDTTATPTTTPTPADAVTGTIAEGPLYAPPTTDSGVVGWTSTTSAPVRFTTGDFSPANSSLACVVTDKSTMADPPVADNVQSYTCTLTAEDSNKNGLTGLTAFTWNTSPNITVSSVTEVDPVNQPGVYTVTLTTTKADLTYTFGAYNAGAPFGSPQTLAKVPFQAGAPIPPDTTNPTCTTGLNQGQQKTTTWATPTSTPVDTNATVKTLVTDQFCNPITNATVAYSPTGSATVAPTTPAATDTTTGIAQATVTDSKAETTTVTATVTGTDPTTKATVTKDGGSADVTFTTGPVSTPVCRVMVDGVYYSVQSTQVYPYTFTTNPSPDPSLVDSYGDPVPMTTASVTVGDNQKVRTYLFDADCNPEVGYGVTFTGNPASQPDSTPTTSTTQGTTDNDGMAQGAVTDTKAETVNVGGTYMAPGVSSDSGALKPGAVTFGVGAFDPSKSVFTVSPSTTPTDASQTGWPTADGTSSYSGTVTAYDANGNLLTNLSASDFTYTVTGTTSASSTAPDEVKLTNFSTDNKGHYYVTITSTIASSDLTVTAAYTGAPDTAATSAQITGSNAKDGTTVTTWMGGKAVASGTGGAPIPFKAGTPVPPISPDPKVDVCTDGRSLSLMTIDSASQPAGTPANVTVYLTDANCNPVKNATVNFAQTGQAFFDPASASVATGDGTNGPLGVATIKVNDYLAETVTVNATSGTAQMNPVNTTFVAGPPVPGPVTCPAGSPNTQGTTLSASPTDVHLTGTPPTGSSTVTALVTDQYCNPETDTSNPVTVDFATTGSSTLSDSSAQTDSTGTATVMLTDTTPETVTVTGTLPVQTGVTKAATINPTKGVDVTFDTSNFSGTNSSFTCVASTTATSGSAPIANGNTTGNDMYTCTILARDANDAPLASLGAGSFTFPVMAGSTTPAPTTLVSPTTVTNQGGGTYTVTLSTTTADLSYTVTAAVGGTPVTGSAVDPVSGKTLTTLQPSTPIPFQAGPAIPPDTTNPTCSDKTSPNNLKTVTTITTKPATTAPKTQTAGTPASITTLVTDENCNPISGADVTWTPNSNSATATVDPITATTGTDGKATATVNDRVAEYVSVSASEVSQGVTQAAGSDAVTFLAGDPVNGPVTDCPTSDMSGSNLTATSPVQVGGTSTATAKVTDANCNVVANVPVTFSVTSPSDGASVATTPGSVVANTNTLGIAQATVTDGTAETALVKGTIAQGDLYAPDGTTTPQTQAPVVFQAGDFSAANSSLACVITDGSANPPVADGQESYTCTLTARDSHDDPLTGLTGFTYDTSSSIQVSDVTEVGGGDYTVQLTTTKADPSYTFGAKYTGIPFGSPQTLAPVPFQAGQAIPPDDTNPTCTTGANQGSPKTNTTATPTSVAATDTTGSKITTLVTDQFCNPITGAVVTFTPGPQAPATADVSATMSPTTATTVNGIATAQVTDKVAEKVTVSTSVAYHNPDNGDPTTTDGGSANVTFTAGTIAPVVCVVTVDGVQYSVQSTQVYPYPFTADPASTLTPKAPMTSATAIVGDTQQARTYLLDADCNPVIGSVANFADVTLPIAGSEVIDPTSVTVDSTGAATTGVTDTKTETVLVGGSYVGATPTDTGRLIAGQITFANGGFDPTKSSFTLKPGGTIPATSNGVPSVDGGNYTATLTARDTSGNLMKGLDVSTIAFASSNTGAAAVSITSPVVNNGDGTYTVTYTSKLADTQPNGTTPIDGVKPLTASVTVAGSAKVPQDPTATTPVTDLPIHFVPGTPVPGPVVCPDPTDTSKFGSQFEVTTNTQTAGALVILKAHVTDDQCNPVDGVPVTFTTDSHGQLLQVAPGDGTMGTTAGTLVGTAVTIPSASFPALTQTAVVLTDPGNAWVELTDYVAPDTTVVHATIMSNGAAADLNGGTPATSSPQTVTWNAGGPSPTCTPEPGSPNTTPSNISAVSPVTIPTTSKVDVLVTDQYCNPLPNIPVDFTIASPTGTIPASAKTGDGTNGTTLGVATVQAGDTTPETTFVEGTVNYTSPDDGTLTTFKLMNLTATRATKSGDGTGADIQFLAVGIPAIVTPANGDTVVTTEPPIKGTGAITGDTITVNDANGKPIPGCTAIKVTSTNGSWTCKPTSPLISGKTGTATLTPVQSDGKGNTATGPSVTFNIDTTPSTITSPKDGALINTATPKITGTGAVPGSTVTVLGPNGKALPGCTNVTTTSTDGTWSCTPAAPGLPDGKDTLTPVVTDKDGNSLKGTPTTITVDTTPPPAPIVNPTDGTKITGETEPGDTLTLTDDNGKPIPGCTDVKADLKGAFMCVPTTPLADGTKVHVTATDAAGNVSPETVVTVVVPKIATGGTLVSNAPAVAGAGLFAVAMVCLLVVVGRRRKEQ